MAPPYPLVDMHDTNDVFAIENCLLRDDNWNIVPFPEARVMFVKVALMQVYVEVEWGVTWINGELPLKVKLKTEREDIS